MYINLKMKAKHSRKYPDLSIGDDVYIYSKKALFEKAHVSVLSSDSYRNDGFLHSQGLTFYHTTVGERPFPSARCALLDGDSTDSNAWLSIVCLISRDAKKLKCYYDDLEIIQNITQGKILNIINIRYYYRCTRED